LPDKQAGFFTGWGYNGKTIQFLIDGVTPVSAVVAMNHATAVIPCPGLAHTLWSWLVRLVAVTQFRERSAVVGHNLRFELHSIFNPLLLVRSNDASKKTRMSWWFSAGVSALRDRRKAIIKNK
jgi:hypothetical protein